MDIPVLDETMAAAPPVRARPGVRGWVGLLILGAFLLEVLVLSGTLLLGSFLPAGAIGLIAIVIATFVAGKAVGLHGARWWILAGVVIFLLDAGINLALLALMEGQVRTILENSVP